MTIYLLAYYMQVAGSLLIAMSCLHHYKFRSKVIRILCLIAALSLLFSISQEISEYFFKNKGINEIANLYVLIEYVLFGYLFYVAMKQNRVLSMITSLLIVIYFVYYIIVVVNFPEKSFSLIRTGRDLSIMIFALLYFYFLLVVMPEGNLFKLPMFWICSFSIFFFSGTFILSFMVDYLVQVLGNDLTGFWAFRNFFRFVFCLGLAYAGLVEWRMINRQIRSSS